MDLKKHPMYETLTTFILDYGVSRGKVDTTLFIRKHKKSTLLEQIYVNNIIFRFM